MYYADSNIFFHVSFFFFILTLNAVATTTLGIITTTKPIPEIYTMYLVEHGVGHVVSDIDMCKHETPRHYKIN